MTGGTGGGGVSVDVRIRGRDGRLYPARALTPDERRRARVLAHNLVHRDLMSVRAAQQVMAETYGVRRSVGTIAADLANFECAHCAEDA
jgi:hypothetical protein